MVIARTVLALASLLISVYAFAADLGGTWKASFDTQIGKQNYTYTFVVKGNELTGKANWGTGESALTNGSVSGDTVTFVETFVYEGNPLKITYSGKIVSADEIRFTRQVADFATEELTAKRAK